MILRSSSNPVLGTLLSPFSDSPIRDSDIITTTTQHHHHHRHHQSLLFHDHKKLFSSHGLQHLHLIPISWSKASSSPVSEHYYRQENNNLHRKDFRRAWSDSNLEKIVYPSSSSDHKEELRYCSSYTPTKHPEKNYTTMLESEPSFSIYNVSDHGLEDEEKNKLAEEEGLTRTVTMGDVVEDASNGGFSFAKKRMGLIEEEEGEEEQEQNQDQEDLNGIGNLNLNEVKEPVSPPMYLASGLGIDGIDFGGGSSRDGGGGFDSAFTKFDESGDLEQYYKRMVDEFPCHPLFLANYAQLLQSKGRLHGAEEYYHRATLADPDDGVLLMKYAKIDWQLHHDKDRALSNFEHAVQISPQDSHVLGACASFLWEIEDEGEEDGLKPKHVQVEVSSQDFEPLQLPPTVDVGDDAVSTANVEEYYKKMVEENPSNSLVLRNYAQFLHKSKGDLQGAQEYCSRAILADPGDGEIKSQYAKLVWELNRDHDKALSYFEQAVQAAPQNSHVLAAYANFLSETEEQEDSTSTGQSQEANHRGSSVTAATA